MRGRKEMLYDDDEDNICEKPYIESLDEDEDEDDMLEHDEDIFKILDPDILKYLNDDRSFSKKSFIKPSSLIKKKKKDKIIYEIGEKIKIKNEKCCIIYGPYEIEGKQMYEIETNAGNIISIEDKFIEKFS